jgi:hypothetical protein
MAMSERVEIRGGAGEFEAALVAMVLDRIAQEQRAAGQPAPGTGLSAWVRAIDPDEDEELLEVSGPGL